MRDYATRYVRGLALAAVVCSACEPELVIITPERTGVSALPGACESTDDCPTRHCECGDAACDARICAVRECDECAFSVDGTACDGELAAGTTCANGLCHAGDCVITGITESWGADPAVDHPDTVEDTFININTEVNVTRETLHLYTTPAQTVANAILMKWDLTAIPANASIDSARLTLHQFESAGDPYSAAVHQVINHDPDFAACDGFTYDGVNPWTANADCCANDTDLGQSDIAPAEDVVLLGMFGGLRTWSVRRMAEDWLRNPDTDFGLMINSDPAADRSHYRYFRSSEWGTASERPLLVITHGPENWARGQPVQSAGNEYAPGSELRVNDGVRGGQHWAAQGSEWVVIDLGSERTVRRVRVWPAACGATCYYDDAWRIQYATTAEPGAWSDFSDVTKIRGGGTLAGPGVSVTGADPGGDTPVAAFQEYEFLVGSAAVRFVRFEVTAGDRDGDSNLSEIEVY